MRQPEVAKLELIRRVPDPVAWLQKRLEAVYLEGTGLLRVSLRPGDDAVEDQVTIVNAVVNAYMKEVVEREGMTKAQRVSELEKAYIQSQAVNREKQEMLRKQADEQGSGERASLEAERLREEQSAVSRELRRVRLALVAVRAGGGGKKEEKALAEQEKYLTGERERLSRELERRPHVSSELEALRGEVRRTQALAGKLGEQLDAARYDLASPPRIKVLEEAAAPGQKK
jgi:hypothetical protein